MEATLIRHGAVIFCAVVLTGISAKAADQSQIGAGNARAQQIGSGSPLVQSAVDLLEQNAKRIDDAQLRAVTLDSFLNPNTCIRHRANVTDESRDFSSGSQRWHVVPDVAADVQGDAGQQFRRTSLLSRWPGST